MMADVDEAKLALEVETLGGEGYEGRAEVFVGDLRERLAMANLMAATLDAFEGIDVLVNASRDAGRLRPAAAPSTTSSRRCWRRT